MERKELIYSYFNNGFNCAQVIASEYSQLVKINKKDLLAVTSGLGGGIGRQGLTCGALTGAVIIIGSTMDQINAGDSNSKETTYRFVNEFFSRFIRIHNAVTCKELLGCDITTPEGLEMLKQGYYREKCSGFLETSMLILDDMLKVKLLPVD